MNSESEKVLFIAVEGIDGSGTTTFIDGLKTVLEQNSYSVHTTHEPSPLPSGLLIRNLLSGKNVDNYVLALLFAADRILHYEKEILPELQKGKIVITDRYTLSSVAYQGVTEGNDFVQSLNTRVPSPDLLIYLSIDTAVAGQRIDKRGLPREALEKIEFQKKVADNYNVLVNEYSHPKVILDAEQAPGKLVSDAIKHLKTTFGI